MRYRIEIMSNKKWLEIENKVNLDPVFRTITIERVNLKECPQIDLNSSIDFIFSRQTWMEILRPITGLLIGL